MRHNARDYGDIDPVRARIGDNVRAELGRRRRSQDWLADVLGLSQPQVSKRLVGRIGFEARELVLVAEALEVPTSAFFQDVAAPADEVRAA
jgi:predicted transcriptional regulator